MGPIKIITKTNASMGINISAYLFFLKKKIENKKIKIYFDVTKKVPTSWPSSFIILWFSFSPKKSFWFCVKCVTRWVPAPIPLAWYE